MLLKITAGIALRKRLTKSVNQKLRSGNEGLKSVFCFPITHQDRNSHLFKSVFCFPITHQDKNSHLFKSVLCFPITHQDKNSHLFARGLKWTKLKLEN